MTDDRELRRDERAWAEIHRSIESGSWRTINRAVATSLPAARERGLLDAPWKVYLFPPDERTATRAHVTIDPSGHWMLAAEGRDGDVTTHATSDRVGIYATHVGLASRVRYVLRHVFDD